jgi:hypothetical protein
VEAEAETIVSLHRPYTKKEEADFYGRNANGPVTTAWS